jgi:hypothetical protein
LTLSGFSGSSLFGNASDLFGHVGVQFRWWFRLVDILKGIILVVGTAGNHIVIVHACGLRRIPKHSLQVVINVVMKA